MACAFTPRDSELLLLALQCTKGGDIKIDYARFAEVAGLASAKGGADAWSRLKKKLQSMRLPAGDGGPDVTAMGSLPTKSAKKTAKPRGQKRKVKFEMDAGDMEYGPAAKMAKKKTASDGEKEDDEEGEDTVHSFQNGVSHDATTAEQDRDFLVFEQEPQGI